MNKICNRCDVEKDINDFYKGNAKCKKCKIEYQKEFASLNKDNIKKYKHQYHVNNLDSIKNKKKEYYKENREHTKTKSAKHYSLNKDAKLKYQKEYAENNRENRNLYTRNRCKTDNLFRMKCSIHGMISRVFRDKNYTKKSRSHVIIGCPYEFLLSYLESKFESWMTWENKGLYSGELNYGWDIDHIIPLSSAINESELLKLNHYTNLQPLDSYINRNVKRDSLDYFK